MRDPIRDVVEQTGMSYEDFKKLPTEPWQNYVAAILLGILALALRGPVVYSLLTLEVHGISVYLGLTVGLGCLVLAFFAYLARDSVLVRWLQVLAAISAGVVQFFDARSLVVKIFLFYYSRLTRQRMDLKRLGAAIRVPEPSTLM